MLSFNENSLFSGSLLCYPFTKLSKDLDVHEKCKSPMLSTDTLVQPHGRAAVVLD